MRKELEKTYNPSEIEDRLYAEWCEKKYFTANPKAGGKPYTIVIPPPNVTGQLHMGHALDETLQDILIRYKRMQGYNTLWLPGTDHAGIATQIKVEEHLRKTEGISRYDLGREKFLERVWNWKGQYGSRIINQLKKLGSSCDWSRERFTMDEGCSKAVKATFCSLYEKGLIYRGHRIINWCPRCLTALSDAEVSYEDQKGAFWHIRYPVKDSDEFLEIATTRPETLLGDTAVAVHPEDERYAHLVGKVLILPLVEREIPVVADEYVEKDFGTGCVKITPAHDPNDFMVGERHNLEQIKIMTDEAKIVEGYGRYSGMDRYEARKAIVEDLKEQGYLVKIEDYNHNVGVCYRCGTTVEPMTSDQWFVKMEPLAKEAIRVVEEGEIKFEPERFSKIYLHWMNNIRDWCISRQLWWGHRIPAFYCDDCGKMEVSEEASVKCPCCGKEMRQESDVLDTWFSSALWPFSTLGWPDNTEELSFYYPTTTLVTGYDIIPFWVSRMIVMGMEMKKEKPFETVFIHGLVRDAQGRKMSKSLGNGIDPLEIIEKYGADALRFALATGNSPGNDMRFSDEKIEAAKNFNNKIWNAARFVLMNLDIEKVTLPDPVELETEDKWILSRLNTITAEVCDNLDHYELGIALAKMYDFIWNEFCDWYIELLKPRFADKGSKSNHVAQNTISYVLSQTLKLLHPYMPFITEEIRSSLPEVEGDNAESIMIAKYPSFNSAYCFKEDEERMGKLIDLIRAIRNRRAEMNVQPSRKTKLLIVSDRSDVYNEKASKFLVKLAYASEVEYPASCTNSNTVQIVAGGATVYIPMGELVDLEKEKARLNGECNKVEGEIGRLKGKLSNQSFLAKAPAAVVEGEQAKLAKYKEQLAQLKEALAKLV